VLYSQLNITLPRNAVQVYAELYASGNGNEEFWVSNSPASHTYIFIRFSLTAITHSKYYNIANEFISALPAGTSFGQGPFREVRLLVDDQLAGVAFPYATIFTGGIIPSAWRYGHALYMAVKFIIYTSHRPITSYGALDLPTYFLDLTPFVPLLTDGNPHTFTLDVASAEIDHAINDNWYVSGLLQVITDPSGKPTTGNITAYNAEPYARTTTTGDIAPNGDVTITVTATRHVSIEADILSGSGESRHVVWQQDLHYSNTQYYLDGNSEQVRCSLHRKYACFG
jgi:Peptide N-acetyl-beta-D-glucosaminyl asparaginase amidase A